MSSNLTFIDVQNFQVGITQTYKFKMQDGINFICRKFSYLKQM